MKPFAVVLFAALVVSAPVVAEEGRPPEKAELSQAQLPAAPKATAAEKAAVLVPDATTTAAPPDPSTAILMIVGLLALGWLAGRG
jgi:hypothetical protein